MEACLIPQDDSTLAFSREMCFRRQVDSKRKLMRELDSLIHCHIRITVLPCLAFPFLPKPSMFKAKFATAKLRINNFKEYCVLCRDKMAG